MVGVVERATGSDKLDSFLGLHKRNPLLAAVLLVLFLSLAGIPPLVGFWAKFNLFAAVLASAAAPFPLRSSPSPSPSAPSRFTTICRFSSAPTSCLPADDSPIKVHPVTLIVLVAIAAAVRRVRLFPGAAAELDREFLPGDVVESPPRGVDEKKPPEATGSGRLFVSTHTLHRKRRLD